MEAFEVTVKKQSYRIIRDSYNDGTFNVFNHNTCHIIRKNSWEVWERVEHRFGTEDLPVSEIGDAIDKHYNFLAMKAASGIR